MSPRRKFLLAVAALFVLLAVAVVSGMLAVVHAAFALPLGVMVLGVVFGGRLRGHYDDRINPATGLPILGSSPLDVGGNPCGVISEINPITGSPMMTNSHLDVMGNGVGESRW